MKWKNFFTTSFIAALLGLMLFTPGVEAQLRQADDDSTRIHRVHVLMNHVLIMFLDGINLKMISNMKMSPVFDPRTEAYALQNMEKGKKALEMALRGEQMEILLEQGFGDHPLMKTAMELGEAMLELVSVLEKMDMDKVTPENMALRHMHLLLNKGLENVAQGSNMIMGTLLASIPQIDRYLQNQGRNMVTNGRALIVEVSSGEEYVKALEGSGNRHFIDQTKRCTELSLDMADILSRMEMQKTGDR